MCGGVGLGDAVAKGEEVFSILVVGVMDGLVFGVFFTDVVMMGW